MSGSHAPRPPKARHLPRIVISPNAHFFAARLLRQIIERHRPETQREIGLEMQRGDDLAHRQPGDVGERMGKQVVALITDMDQPLGRTIGNALEVVEVVEVLRGEGPEDLRQLCLELAGWMLHLGGVSDSVAEGKKTSEKLIASGKTKPEILRCLKRYMAHVAGACFSAVAASEQARQDQRMAIDASGKCRRCEDLSALARVPSPVPGWRASPGNGRGICLPA